MLARRAPSPGPGPRGRCEFPSRSFAAGPPALCERALRRGLARKPRGSHVSAVGQRLSFFRLGFTLPRIHGGSHQVQAGKRFPNCIRKLAVRAFFYLYRRSKTSVATRFLDALQKATRPAPLGTVWRHLGTPPSSGWGYKSRPQALLMAVAVVGPLTVSAPEIRQNPQKPQASLSSVVPWAEIKIGRARITAPR